MIVAGSASPLLLSSAGGYNLTNSLRFRSSASAYLNRTLGSSGSLRAWTWSAWVKRGTLGVQQDLFGWVDLSGGNFQQVIGFNSDNTLEFQMYNSIAGGYVNRKTTSQVFRDPSAWYHIVVVWDSNNATANDRAIIYINGSRVTAWANNTNPSLNQDSYINNSSYPLGIARCMPSSSNYFDGYLTEINFVNAQALTPSSFGQTSATTGVWIPKKYTGTYGTNGFYLPFTDNSALTTSSNVGLGKDFSGNSNYWTTNNISITAGSTYDSMTDVPTLTSATAANYCVINPLSNGNQSVTAGNLNISNASSAWYSNISTIGVSSGKWYFEATVPTYWQYGHIGVLSVAQTPLSQYVGYYPAGWAYQTDGRYWNNNVDQTGKTVTSSGDVLMVAFDMDNSKIWFGKNGTWFDSGNPASGTNAQFTNLSGTLAPAFSVYSSSSGFQANFGQRPFAYTPPTGFNRLNTFNLPTPTIGATASTTANKYFDATLYTGNGLSSQVVTNSGSMQPDFVWIKSRNQAFGHLLFDSVRGISLYLQSNSTGAEVTDVNMVSSFNSNGFTVGSSGFTNGNTYTQVGWQWRASNATAVTNTNGSITSTVSANTTAGFSIVTYTGTGSNATVGHGLGVAPSMIIVKRRDAGGSGWSVYFTTLPAGYVLSLQSTGGQANSSGRFTTTLPTSSVFSIGTDSDLNGSGGTYVAYCFAQVAGYSAFGSYTGNGSTDGPFVFTGFRPRYVIAKCSGTTGPWNIFDSARGTYNVNTPDLWANSSNAETGNNIDFLSNGFKVRDGGGDLNASSQGFIYMAFAESPFKYANAR